MIMTIWHGVGGKHKSNLNYAGTGRALVRNLPTAASGLQPTQKSLMCTLALVDMFCFTMLLEHTVEEDLVHVCLPMSLSVALSLFFEQYYIVEGTKQFEVMAV